MMSIATEGSQELQIMMNNHRSCSSFRFLCAAAIDAVTLMNLTVDYRSRSLKDASHAYLIIISKTSLFLVSTNGH